MDDLELELPEIPDLDEDLEEHEEETPELDRFEYIMTLEGSELVDAIMNLEAEKSRLSFKTMDIKELIKINPKVDVDVQTLNLANWDDIKRFTIMDFEKNTLIYPRYDEQMESDFFKHKKNLFVAPLGFDYMDATSITRPLGIEIIRISHGKKIINPRDKRFLSPDTKRTEEIFLYNFDTKDWARVKPNNPDYLQRIKVTNYIEKTLRKALSNYYYAYSFLTEQITYKFSSTTKTHEVKLLMKKIRKATSMMPSLLFILQFYYHLNNKDYEFLNLEIDYLISAYNSILSDFDLLVQDAPFDISFAGDIDFEEKKTLKAKVRAIENTHMKLFITLNLDSLCKESTRISELPFHERSSVKTAVERAFYIKKTDRQLRNSLEIYGEDYKKIPNISTVMLGLKRTKFAVSQTIIDDVFDALEPLFDSDETY